MEHGANVNSVDKYGKTLLMYFLCNGNIDIVQYLVEHGAKVNKANDSNND